MEETSVTNKTTSAARTTVRQRVVLGSLLVLAVLIGVAAAFVRPRK